MCDTPQSVPVWFVWRWFCRRCSVRDICLLRRPGKHAFGIVLCPADGWRRVCGVVIRFGYGGALDVGYDGCAGGWRVVRLGSVVRKAGRLCPVLTSALFSATALMWTGKETPVLWLLFADPVAALPDISLYCQTVTPSRFLDAACCAYSKAADSSDTLGRWPGQAAGCAMIAAAVTGARQAISPRQLRAAFPEQSRRDGRFHVRRGNRSARYPAGAIIRALCGLRAIREKCREAKSKRNRKSH